ncbi:adenylosuccinate synthase [uncultured archaeon]|nr:adenylosuccinate synthase [uncultured archaeon]HKJ97241.1 adenylosuccinate synthase [Thermoplasmataceae archaeon]
MITVILGLQFGDEGKGKVTDYLSEKYSTVVRFNGGNNAGHTVVTDKGLHKFYLIPAGALRSRNVILGNGMVIDPFGLLDEIDKLKHVHADVQIKISRLAHVVTPLHKFLDKAEEEIRSKLRIGTTAQGIGPTYEDKYARTGVRMVDLLDREILTDKVETIFRMKKALLEGSEFNSDDARFRMVEKLLKAGKEISKYLDYTEDFIFDSYEKGENILFEGAQGTMLDIDFGLYPFVTSSNTLAGALSNGSGFPFRKVDRVIGVVKAYTSKVGAGPFPTEISGEDADRLRGYGNEYGTTTGRPRRVGWLDLNLLSYAIRINDVDTLAITKIDTLGQMDRVYVGERYSLDGEEIKYIPRSLDDLEKVKVSYREFKPWGDLSDIGKDGKRIEYSDLPREVKEYIEYIENRMKRPVEIISLGADRNKTIRKPL